MLLMLMGIISYFQIKSEITKIGKDFSESLSKEVVYSTNEWIETRGEFLEIYSQYLKELENLELLLIDIDKNRVFFDHYQILLDEKSVILDGKYYEVDSPLRSDNLSTCKDHKILGKTTIDVCRDIGRERKFCGLIEASNLFVNIRRQIHSVVENAYLFDKNEDIIASLNPVLEKPDFHDPKFTKIHRVGEWGIAISISQKSILEKTLRILFTTGLILLTLFVLLAASSGFIYSFINNTFLKKQKEYEVLLSHRLKVSETGEMLSAVSHQLRQSINSSMLMLTSIIKLKKDNKLSDDELIQNLNLCIKSTKMMDKTIDNFKNFYKFSDDISEFDLYSSIKNLYSILHVEFSRKNVSIDIQSFDITLKTSESYLWQVLLVLFQNAKDALSNKKSDKRVTVMAENLGDSVKISVIDNGIGVEESMVKNIFNKQKVSTKADGSGIGLNLAKMIVVEKLQGTLTLKSNKNPTIFELTIKKDIS